MAQKELAIAMSAENAKSVPTPQRIQIQPSSGAARTEMRWLIETPVESVAVTSSRPSAMSRT